MKERANRSSYLISKLGHKSVIFKRFDDFIYSS